MDFIYGISLLLVLVPFTIFLIKLMDFVSVEYWMLVVPLMLFGDVILTFLWIYGFVDFVGIMKMFVLGLGVSFFTNMLFKIYLVLKFQKKQEEK